LEEAMKEAMEEHGGKYKLSLNYIMWMDRVERSVRYFV